MIWVISEHDKAELPDEADCPLCGKPVNRFSEFAWIWQAAFNELYHQKCYRFLLSLPDSHPTKILLLRLSPYPRRK